MEIKEKYISGFIASTEIHYLQKNYKDYIKETKSYEKLIAWKGDKAISKIVLYSKYEDIDYIKVIKTDFINEKGDRLTSKNIKSTFIKEVSASLGSFRPSTDKFIPVMQNYPKEDIPDILCTEKQVSLDKDKLQQIWIEFNIPTNSEPGLYNGTIEIEGENVEKTLVFNYDIEVLNLSKPSYENSKFYLDLWQYPYSVARYYNVEPFSEEHFKILKPHMELYKNYGGKTITTTIVEDPWNHQTYDKYISMVKWRKNKYGRFTFDYSDFDKWVEFNLELGIKKEINAYTMVPWGNRIIYFDENKNIYEEEKHMAGAKEWIEIWNVFLNSFVEHLDKKGWFDMVYIAMDERPIKQMIPALDLIESKKNKDGKTLKVSGAMNYSTMDKTVLNRIHNISIYVGHTDHNSEELKKLAEERRKLGLITTLYTCTGSYPSNFTRSEPYENIWTIWYTAYHNTDGYLRWAYDAWTEKPLEDTSHWFFEAGDTFLVYPGDKEANEIIPRASVRLEKIAEAIRDVEKILYIKENSSKLSGEIELFLRSFNRYTGIDNGFGMIEGSEDVKKAIENEVMMIKEKVIDFSRRFIMEIKV